MPPSAKPANSASNYTACAGSKQKNHSLSLEGEG